MEWECIKSLRNGAVFVTMSGIIAVKSEYHYHDGNSLCILLSSGECGHFSQGDYTLVREIPEAAIGDILLPDKERRGVYVATVE